MNDLLEKINKIDNQKFKITGIILGIIGLIFGIDTLGKLQIQQNT